MHLDNICLKNVKTMLHVCVIVIQTLSMLVPMGFPLFLFLFINVKWSFFVDAVVEAGVTV